MRPNPHLGIHGYGRVNKYLEIVRGTLKLKIWRFWQNLHFQATKFWNYDLFENECILKSFKI